MYCKNCNEKLHPDDQFCPECGTKVNRQTQTQGSPSNEEKTVFQGERVHRKGAVYSQEQNRQSGDQRMYGNDGARTDRPRHSDPYYNNNREQKIRYNERSAMGRGSGYNNRYDGGRGSGYDSYREEEPDNNSNIIMYVILGVVTIALAIGIVWGVVTLVSLNNDEDETYEPATKTESSSEDSEEEAQEGETSEDDLKAETEESITVTPTPTVETVTPAPTEAPQVTQAPAASNGDYIIPDSSTRLISTSELTGLSQWELRVARNEIYARHGRMFKDSALDSYFRGKSWYNPTIPADSFNDNVTLSQTELKNAKTITEYEQAMGY